MDETKDAFFQDLKDELSEYVKLRIELFRVSSYEKIARVTASLFAGLMILILFFFFTVFGSILAGFYFSHLTGSTIIGFGIVTGFYLLLLLVVVIFRKQLFEKMIIDKMIEILFENDIRNTR